MNRERAERITSPLIGVATVLAAVSIVVFPRSTLLVLAAAQVLAAFSCALLTRTARRIAPQAPGAAWLFAGKGVFWLGMAGLFVWMFVRHGSPAA